MSLNLRFIEPGALLFSEAARLRHLTLYADLPDHAVPDFDDKSSEARHLVALQGGRVVGYLRMNVRATTAQLRHICVAEQARGAGVGRALVEAALREARSAGVATLWVNARFTAIGFWRQMGFVVTGDGLMSAENTRVPHKRMQLQVRASGS